MKQLTYRSILGFSLLAIGFTFTSCKKGLEEDNFSQLSSDEFLKTESGIRALSVSAYSNAQFVAFPMNVKINLGELPTDIMFQAGGGVAGAAAQIFNFSWEPTNEWFNLQTWNKAYRAIRDANVLLENIDAATMPETQKNIFKGEARFLRAFSFYLLNDWYGPVPLTISTTENSGTIVRSTEAEMNSFLENEFIESASLLPVVQSDYGRATRGAALGFLTKFYLNTRQWQKCADVAQQLIDLGVYDLHPDYVNMFKVEHERNKEFIFVSPAVNLGGQGNQWMAVSFPATYPRLNNQASFAAMYKLYDNFVNSFAADDVRRGAILTSYTATNGSVVTLLGKNDSRSFKYAPDPSSLGPDAGNDIPELRYADILLARAEALNELNGPTTENIDLVNKVRSRAGVDLFIIGAFTKETLRDAILQERNWEFFTEGFRRQDLIRHGKFITNAVARGKNAKEFHLKYPIPQPEIDVSKISQNDGY